MHNTNVKLGIIYVLWILGAWTFVGFCKFAFFTEMACLGEPISTLGKECFRFLVFMGPIVIFSIYNAKKPWYRWLGLYGCEKNSASKTGIVAFLYATISVLINVCMLHKKAHLGAISPIFLLTTFSLSIIMEEIAFRGFLFYLFEKWNKNTVIIVTSLVFAAKHIPGWLFFPMEISSAGFLGDFVIVFLVGCILGKLYIATHSVWATSFIHSINNLIVALFY